MGHVGLAADGAAVEVVLLGLGLGVVEVDHLGAPVLPVVGPLGGLPLGLPLGGGEHVADVRGEEEQVVQHGHDGDQSQQELTVSQVLDHSQGEVGGVKPGQPLGLDGDDEEEQELQVGVQGGKGEEHGHVYIVHGGSAHQEADEDVQQNAEEVKDGELVAPPLPLQGGADEVVEVEGEGKEEEPLSAVGHEDEGDQTPDLAGENGGCVEAEQAGTQGAAPHAEHIQQVDEHVADDDVAHEPGDTQLRMLVAETIQPLLNGTQRDDLLQRDKDTSIILPAFRREV